MLHHIYLNSINIVWMLLHQSMIIISLHLGIRIFKCTIHSNKKTISNRIFICVLVSNWNHTMPFARCICQCGIIDKISGQRNIILTRLRAQFESIWLYSMPQNICIIEHELTYFSAIFELLKLPHTPTNIHIFYSSTFYSKLKPLIAFNSITLWRNWFVRILISIDLSIGKIEFAQKS